jgi:hypothetical protein
MVLTSLPAFDPAMEAALRVEIDAMAAAYAEALLELAPAQSITGIYAKGSAYKPWDSLIDYVPELSDVDIHVRFVDKTSAARTFGTVQGALNVAGRAMLRFNERCPEAVHRPRPQLVLLNDLESQPGYSPSPYRTVRTLYGQDYQRSTPEGREPMRAEDARRFLRDATFLESEAPSKLVDRPGRLAWHVVSLLMWRIGPAGPRILTQLGVEPDMAWSMNRTSIVHELTARGDTNLAESHVRFYLAGWDGFRSAFVDGDAAARAIIAAETFFREGAFLLGGLDQAD